jgi:bifunctional UDP-N-acetylglucosamine pyrophosphorylase/glucosamine-1-phosphate N-acetyltransferase
LNPSPHITPAAIILAAGMGTRMKSDLPKVLHEVGGRPMLCAVVDACREAGCDRIVLVVGYRQELVREALAAQGDWARGLEYAVQPEQRGTGHAVQCAEPLFADDLRAGARRDAFVLAGDGPLIRASTLISILETHRRTGAAATLATSIIPEPEGYGRIIRDARGNFATIIEHRQCTPAQLAVREVNPSYYCFDLASLFSALRHIRPSGAGGELYITDVPGLLLAEGRRVEVIPAVPPEDVLSINTPQQLAEVDAIYRRRHAPAERSPSRRPASSQGART